MLAPLSAAKALPAHAAPGEKQHMTIAAILKEKGADVVTVAPDTTIAEVSRILAANRIGAMPVADPADPGHVLGMLSERDIVRALAEHGPATLGFPAERLMTRLVATVSPSTTVAQAMEIMTQRRCRHLPVVQNGNMIGMVSIGDIVKARIDEAVHEVESLKAYVAGAA
jgi:CBS domain-containing protein